MIEEEQSDPIHDSTVVPHRAVDIVLLPVGLNIGRWWDIRHFDQGLPEHLPVAVFPYARHQPFQGATYEPVGRPVDGQFAMRHVESSLIGCVLPHLTREDDTSAKVREVLLDRHVALGQAMPDQVVHAT